LAVARRTETLLASGGADPELRRQFSDLVLDLDMAVRLEEIRIRKSELRDDHFDEQGADLNFASAFRDFHIDVEVLTSAEAAARIRARSIPEELVAALDDWANIRERTDGRGGKRLRAVAREADPDPWRNRLRDALERRERKTLEELAASKQVDTWPPSTVILLARALLATKAEGTALTVLRKAQWRRPDDFWINEELGFRLCNSQPPRAEEAIVFHRVATALRPQSAGSYLGLGNALYVQKKLPEAAEAYGRAILLEPGFAAAHFQLGRVLRHQGRLPEAIDAYRRSIELRSDSSSSYTDLGMALDIQGKFPEAEEALRHAVQLEPNSFPAQYHLMQAVGHQRGKRPEAEGAYRREIELKPDSPWPYLGLAHLLFVQRQPKAVAEAVTTFESAIRILEAWLAKDPDNRDARQALDRVYSNRVAALENLGRHAEAIQGCDRWIKLDPKNSEAWSRRAGDYIRVGQFANAVSDHEQALKLNPKAIDPLNNLADLLTNCPDPKFRNPQRAIALARRVVEERPDAGFPWNTLGAALCRGGQWEEAVAALEKAVELNKGGRYSDHFFLAMAQWRLGRKDEARKSYNRAKAWMEKFAPKNEELRRFQSEAEETLELKKK
jgi:tetratricopeptide (TPR) repeat protein